MIGNILKISTLSSTYLDYKSKKKKPAWYDADTLLLHSAFQILVNFIEKEKPEKCIDWNSDPLHKKAWKEINILYKYWKEVRPKLEKEKDETLSAWSKTYESKMIPEYDGKKIKWYRWEKEYKDKKKFDLLWKKLNEIERQFEEMETDILIRLIKVRKYLWV